jgi:hypothetical protein
MHALAAVAKKHNTADTLDVILLLGMSFGGRNHEKLFH